MKKPTCFFIVMFGVINTWGEPVDIPSGQTRAAMVGFAKTLLVPPPSSLPSVDEASFKNPFNPAEPAPSSPVGPSSAVTEVAGPEPTASMRLAEIAPKITPSGMMELGGESILLFGQKKFKVGDILPIIFEGKRYELEIIEIQSTSFTLRLDGVEITRPIKSLSKP